MSVYRNGEFAEYWFGNGLVGELEELVEAHGHELHADPHVALGDEVAEALDNLLAVGALEHHVQVHDDAPVLLRYARYPHLLHTTNQISLIYCCCLSCLFFFVTLTARSSPL